MEETMLTEKGMKNYYELLNAKHDIVGFGILFALDAKIPKNPLETVPESFNEDVEAYLLQRFSGLKNARTAYAFEQELISTQEISWVLDASLNLIAFYYEHQMRPGSVENRKLMKELEDFALAEARYRGVFLDSFYRSWGIPEDKQLFSAYSL